MNGVQITNSLLSDRIVKKTFIGVFAADHYAQLKCTFAPVRDVCNLDG